MKCYTYPKVAAITSQLLGIIIVLLFVLKEQIPLPNVLVNISILSFLGFIILAVIWQYVFSLIIDEKGLTIKRWNFRTINIPWSEIKVKIKAQRFPRFGPPRVTLFLPWKKCILLPRHPHYEELLASICRYAKIEPEQRVREFIEKSRARKHKTYRPFHRILGVLYLGLALSFFLGIQRTLNFGGFDLIIITSYFIGCVFAGRQSVLVRRKTFANIVYRASCLVFILLFSLHVQRMIVGGEALSIVCLTIACAMSIFLAFVSLVFFMNWRRWVIAFILPSIFVASALTWYYQAIPKPDYKKIATIPGMIISSGDITWSPDGELILARTTEEKLYILSSSGGVKSSVEIPNFSLGSVWSPDSSMIAVRTYDKENKRAELFIYDNKLQNRIPVFQAAKVTPSYYLSFREFLYKDCWSPDSRYLLFSLKKDKGRKIYLFDTLTKKLKVIVDDIQNCRWPFWFSNNKIGFLTYKEVQKKKYKYTLWSVNIYSKERKQIYKADKIWPSYRISPNRKYIFVYKTKSDPILEAYLINLKSKAKNTVFPGNLQDVSWSEDSNFLGFVIKKNGESELFKFDILKNKRTSLIKEKGEIRSPRWPASGERICYFLDQKIVKLPGIFSIRKDGGNRLKIWSPSLPVAIAYSFNFASPWSPKEEVLLIPLISPRVKEKTFRTFIYTASFKNN